MVAQSSDDEAERRRWNDEYWASVWPRREQLTGAVTEVLLDAVGLAAGEQVLDIGSGGGTAAFAAAERVGATGSVLGADISVPLVGFATQRARDRGAANVRFVVADVQREAIDGAPFTVAISQFGVMFFDEPVVAFANIRAQLGPGGRLAFVCWQDPAQNPWFVGPSLAPFIAPPPPPAVGKSATGPFSLADPTTRRTSRGGRMVSDQQNSPRADRYGRFRRHCRRRPTDVPWCLRSRFRRRKSRGQRPPRRPSTRRRALQRAPRLPGLHRRPLGMRCPAPSWRCVQLGLGVHLERSL